LATLSLTLFSALIVAIAIIDSALPWFSMEVERQININTFISLPYIIFVTVTFLVLIIAIGFYPSLHFAKSIPMDLLRKRGFSNFSFLGISRATLVFQLCRSNCPDQYP